jgi:AraC family transcriptional regulator
MDRLATETANQFLKIDANGLGETVSACAASCPALQVTYVPRLDESPLKPMTDRIEILMPGDGLFHVMYLGSDGRAQRAIVRSPQVCVVPPNRSFRLACQGPTDVVVMSLDAAYFASRVQEAFGAPREVVERFGASDPFLRGVGNVLRTGFRSQRAPTQSYLESLASVIAIHVAANYDRRDGRASAFSGLAPHKLQRVLDHIEQHLAEAIHVRDLAQVVHMSPYHFARMFKQATGQPPHVYITSQRMDQAKNLLGNSDLSLVQVASSVGYQTQAHFTGVFHKHVGITPRTFRLKYRAEHR